MDISCDRVRSIFDFPKPPKEVWERQFDGFDDDLQRLAKTHWEKIDFSDLWYYHHDLAYLWANDSMIYDARWMPNNLQFLRETLTVDFVVGGVSGAAEFLRNEPEYRLAKQVQSDLDCRLEIVAARVKELPALLDHPSPERWSI